MKKYIIIFNQQQVQTIGKANTYIIFNYVAKYRQEVMSRRATGSSVFNSDGLLEARKKVFVSYRRSQSQEGTLVYLQKQHA